VVETAEKRGAFSCGYHASQAALAPKGYLTGAEWDWSTPYALIVKAAMEGKPHPNFVRGGLKDGFVKPSPYGGAVPATGRKVADDIKAKMAKGEFVIFKGPLKDNKGKAVIPAGTAYEQTNAALESMNYLVDGVVGQIPG
jgi:simple sugar transport system substrate-binding protein